MPTPISIKNLILSLIESYEFQKLQKQRKLTPESERDIRGIFDSYKGSNTISEHDWRGFKENVIRELKRLHLSARRDKEILALLDAIQSGQLKSLQDLDTLIKQLKANASYGIRGSRGSNFFPLFEALFKPAAAPPSHTAAIMAPKGRASELAAALLQSDDIIKIIDKSILSIENTKASYEMITSSGKKKESYLVKETDVINQAVLIGFAPPLWLDYSAVRKTLQDLIRDFKYALYEREIRRAINEADLMEDKDSNATISSITAYSAQADSIISKINSVTGLYQTDITFSINSAEATKARSSFLELNNALLACSDNLKHKLEQLKISIEQLQAIASRPFADSFMQDTLAEFQILTDAIKSDKFQFEELACQISKHSASLFNEYAKALNGAWVEHGVTPAKCREAIAGMLKSIYLIKNSKTLRDELRAKKFPKGTDLSELSSEGMTMKAQSVKEEVQTSKRFYSSIKDRYSIPFASESKDLTEQISIIQGRQKALLKGIEDAIRGLRSVSTLALRTRPLPIATARVRDVHASATGGSGGAAAGRG
jgi:hypothetical protein